MKQQKLKRFSLVSLITGYILSVLFILLIIINQKTETKPPETIIQVVERNNTIVRDRLVHQPVIPKQDTYIDYLPETSVKQIITTPHNTSPTYINKTDELEISNRMFDRHHDLDTVDNVTHNYRGTTHVDGHNRNSFNSRHRRDDVVDRVVTQDDEIDPGLLDRRIQQLEGIGIDTRDDVDIGRLSPVSGDDSMELGDVNDFDKLDISVDGGYGTDKGGQLFAYNFPSQGVGAGVGSSALGAGGGAGAGIGAGIGQGVANGESVPTLGGVGTYIKPDETTGGGTGGLVSGAGAGSAAGLYNGMVMVKLGPTGAPGTSGPGIGGYNYDHLPDNGALHIMMHVDGSGSILNTRKQLEIMKDTLLKQALLPYYNNDESLYNKRVTIVDGNGERTLNFYTEAAKKDNVLAIVFQDEAQPSYHLPNFNKSPEAHYLDDLNNLKASLDGYAGVYRGVMFQVDRGRTFAKSFKEFVNNSFQGHGYLSMDNLKKYHRDHNPRNITNKTGVVFSDEYHAKDSGDPQYYLNLIKQAAMRVGLNLDTQKGGLYDGKSL